jgi:bla regulator protein BlaR1
MTTQFLSQLLTDLSAFAPVIANHLWQSTLFAAAVFLVTLLLLRNTARIRSVLWLAASIKFLLPFSLLICIGALLPGHHRDVASTPAAIYSAVDTVGEPFSDSDFSPVSASPAHPATLLYRLHSALPLLIAAVWLTGTIIVLLVWFARWRQVRAMLRYTVPASSCRELHLLRQLQSAPGLSNSLALRLSNELMEPGIFGILHPVLLWPSQLSPHLTDGHIEAILVHELMHLRRRDNLAAALHMLVESLFWFHPAVWWIERRIVEERERACDEAVVAHLGSAETYAESLLRACRFCVESPLPCVSGISGASLAHRVRSIITFRAAHLTFARKFILAAFALTAISAPIAFGVVRMIPLYGQMIHATGPLPSYEVATIKPVDEFAAPQAGQMRTTIKDYILNSYGMSSLAQYQIEGGPAWISKDLYVIDGKVPDNLRDAMQKMTPEQQSYKRCMLMQSLLVDRFKLKVHFVTKQMPVYELSVAKSGLKIKEVPPLVPPGPGAAPPPPPTPGAALPRGALSMQTNDGVTTLNLRAAKMRLLINMIWRDPEIAGRPIVDKTGVTGSFDVVDLQWVGLTAPSDAVGPSLPTAFEEQLGLKLTATKGPVDVVVIDSIERPSPN